MKRSKKKNVQLRPNGYPAENPKLLSPCPSTTQEPLRALFEFCKCVAREDTDALQKLVDEQITSLRQEIDPQATEKQEALTTRVQRISSRVENINKALGEVQNVISDFADLRMLVGTRFDDLHAKVAARLETVEKANKLLEGLITGQKKMLAELSADASARLGACEDRLDRVENSVAATSQQQAVVDACCWEMKSNHDQLVARVEQGKDQSRQHCGLLSEKQQDFADIIARLKTDLATCGGRLGRTESRLDAVSVAATSHETQVQNLLASIEAHASALSRTADGIARLKEGQSERSIPARLRATLRAVYKSCFRDPGRTNTASDEIQT